MDIHIVSGTHEELYDLLRDGKADLVLSDQRRAFSDLYVNYELMQCTCCAELSQNNPLAAGESVTLEELKQIPCILISSKEQQNAEQEYYENTLGFGGSYLFAENPEEGRLLAVSNRGFLPVENVGTLPPEAVSLRRLPIFRDGRPVLAQLLRFLEKGTDKRRYRRICRDAEKTHKRRTEQRGEKLIE